MSLLRGFLFGNLGIKLTALLLALLVYLNVYTDRPATLSVSFPIRFSDLADTLSLVGQPPGVVRVELRGTGKQLIRLRLTEPPIRISLAGVGTGRYERLLTPADLPLPAGVELEVDRMVSPRTLELELDRRVSRPIVVKPRVEGAPAAGALVSGAVSMRPMHVRVIGPARVVQALDTVALHPVSIAGRRDTVTALVAPAGIPHGCAAEPAVVEVRVPIEPALTRRVVVPIESPRGASGYVVVPDRVAIVVTAPRRSFVAGALEELKAYWTSAAPVGAFVGKKVPVRREGRVPEGAQVRLEPDSVTLRLAP